MRSSGDPALAITKGVAPDPAWAGELLTYTILLSQTGGLEDPSGMQVTDTVPLSTTCCLTISHGGTLVGRDVVWTGHTITQGSSMSLTFVVTVSQVPSGTVIANEAYRAVITTTKGVTAATGSPVNTTVRENRQVYLPLILKSQ